MSWLDTEEIERLRTVLNKNTKHAAIPKGSPSATWSAIQSRFHDTCSEGSAECIVASLLQKPRAPTEWTVKRTEWLSSLDIEKVEQNFEELFPQYKCLGTVPIDFDLRSETNECIVNALCNIKLPSLSAKGKHKIGIVFNTDVHDGPGQHWIALFADIHPDLEHPRITYFDSYARKPEKEIQTLMHRWKEQWDATGTHQHPTELTYNSLRHQFKGSECGMYCLYFHYACLMDISMEKQIPDDVMNSFRNTLFSIPKTSGSTL